MRPKDSDEQIARRLHIGQQIRRWRERANMSQAELARRVGRSFQVVWNWENVAAGKRPTAPVSSLLPVVAKALGCEVADLTGESTPDGNAFELAVRRLERKAGHWRIEEFSRLPEDRLKATIDSAVSEYKDSKEGRRRKTADSED